MSSSPSKSSVAASALVAGIPLALVGVAAMGAGAEEWRIHDMERPRPPVVTPGESPGQPPADAVVLFSGASLEAWASAEGGAAEWKVENGYAEVVAGKGAIHTRDAFGDCQLHLEFSTPPPKGDGQGRGNSGLFFMDRYEVQVLDSHDNDTYPDGQAGAVYGQQPPLVNVSRPAGEWQSYDVIFRRPRFDAGGRLLSPARLTVLHNGVLVQDGTEPTGPTTWRGRPGYAPHPDALPISLQDHGNPMRFRNIWVRRLDDPRPQPVRVVPPARGDDAGELARFTGRFEQNYAVVPAQGGGLLLLQGENAITGLVPDGERRFRGTTVGIAIEFGDRDDAQGRPAQLTMKLEHSATRLERVE